MTTGRINQVCALPTVVMPGAAARKIRSYTIERAVLPKEISGQQKQQAILQSLVNRRANTLHAMCFTQGLPRQHRAVTRTVGNVSKAQPAFRRDSQDNTAQLQEPSEMSRKLNLLHKFA